jgi:hypothetical protein
VSTAKLHAMRGREPPSLRHAWEEGEHVVRFQGGLGVMLLAQNRDNHDLLLFGMASELVGARDLRSAAQTLLQCAGGRTRCISCAVVPLGENVYRALFLQHDGFGRALVVRGGEDGMMGLWTCCATSSTHLDSRQRSCSGGF